MITEYSMTLENKTKSELILFIKELQDMLKEKDRQINSKNGTINALQCALKERTEERDRKDNIIARQLKQIDLMARAIDNYDSQLVINTFRNKEHAKQYFKEIAEENSSINLMPEKNQKMFWYWKGRKNVKNKR